MRTTVAGTAALILGLIAAPLSAQNGTITGRVMDAESGTGLRDAGVEVLGTGGDQAGGVLTDNSGAFQISLSPGSYSLVISLIGYETQRLDGVSVASGQSTNVTIELNSTALVLNPIVVTASRREEKALDSPASVQIVGEELIEGKAAATATEHLKGLAGVDISQTGLSQSNVVARGFNNVFSGALLVLTDNRIARVPSLRVNAWNFIPMNNLDIQRMEVVLGPGAALYGPNSASGVVHMISSSPIDDPGTSASIAGGERSVFQGQFRTAYRASDAFGFKLSGQYFQGNDWEYTDPAEELARAANPTDPRIGVRDFDQQRWGLDGRFDFRPSDNTEIIFAGGTNKAVSSIEMTGIGSGQADGWSSSYLQSRVTNGRFFAQAFMNTSNAGDTYLLRTGQPISDESKLYATQVQHGIEIGDGVQDFIYGVDFLWTRPETGGTINGRNEDDDDINEVGGYLHSTTRLADNVDLVAALRVDDHSELDDLVFSPRAALVFRPSEDQNFRVTFNRAFSTPTSNNLFLDISAGGIPIPGTNGYDVRAMGTPETGFTWNETCTGGLQNFCMYSPFLPGQQLPANGAVLFNSLIPVIVQGAAAANPALQPLVATMTQLLTAGNPLGAINSVLLRLNTEDSSFNPDLDGPTPIERLKPTITNTVELGYKGLLGGRFLLAADVYRSKVEDFVGPLRVETPHVFLDPATTGAYIGQQLQPIAGLLGPLFSDVVTGLTQGMAQIPLGSVVPDQIDAETVLVAYRNFGDVTFWGADFAGQFLATDRVSIDGSLSIVSKDCFDGNEDGTVNCSTTADIALNAPKTKGSVGLRFDDERSGFAVDGRARFTKGFPMNSGVFFGEIEGYAVFDANVSYQLPFYPGATAGLTVSNLFNNEHQEFIGAPELGRLLLFRLQIDT